MNEILESGAKNSLILLGTDIVAIKETPAEMWTLR
jgi:hypothetical protein